MTLTKYKKNNNFNLYVTKKTFVKKKCIVHGFLFKE